MGDLSGTRRLAQQLAEAVLQRRAHDAESKQAEHERRREADVARGRGRPERGQR